jgi:hypothetical protein
MRAACTVLDISSAGACLRLEAPAPRTATLRLIIGNVPPIVATPAWRKSALLGVHFPCEQQWVLDSCAGSARRL